MLLKLDIVKALEIGLIAIVFTFFFVDVFDNTGTLVGVAHKAGLVKPDGTLPRAQRALTADSAAAMAGEVDLAKSALRQLRGVQPHLSLAYVASEPLIPQETERQHYLEAFRRAGLD